MTLFWELYMINDVQLVSLNLSIYALASLFSSSSPNKIFTTLLVLLFEHHPLLETWTPH